jgi:hypothetical protein
VFYPPGKRPTTGTSILSPQNHTILSPCHNHTILSPSQNHNIQTHTITWTETDQPPLYILVEGDTENAVTQAMMELTRHLREGLIAAEEEANTRGPTGRYSVL